MARCSSRKSCWRSSPPPSGPWLARRLGLRGVLLLGLGGDLAVDGAALGEPAADRLGRRIVLLCVATGALGLGFGATVMALNTLVEGLFPGRADGAVLALNALLGLGTALAPLLVALFTALGAWWALPLLMAILATLLSSRSPRCARPWAKRSGPARAQAAFPGGSGYMPRRRCSMAWSKRSAAIGRRST